MFHMALHIEWISPYSFLMDMIAREDILQGHWISNDFLIGKVGNPRRIYPYEGNVKIEQEKVYISASIWSPSYDENKACGRTYVDNEVVPHFKGNKKLLAELIRLKAYDGCVIWDIPESDRDVLLYLADIDNGYETIMAEFGKNK